MWSLAWWPYAVLHGMNPLITHTLFVPDRINLAATSPTLCPLAGIVGAPLTIAFGPIVAYNLLMLASPVLAAFFAFLLCRYITNNFAASLFGGYVFGFSTYILGHMEGHLQLVLIFPIPGRGSPRPSPDRSAHQPAPFHRPDGAYLARCS